MIAAWGSLWALGQNRHGKCQPGTRQWSKMAGFPSFSSPLPWKIILVSSHKSFAAVSCPRVCLNFQGQSIHFLNNFSGSQDLLVLFKRLLFITWKKIKIVSNPLTCEVKKKVKTYCSSILYFNPLEEEGVHGYLTFQEIEVSFLPTLSLVPEGHWWDQA